MTILHVPVTAANDSEWKRRSAGATNQIINALAGYQPLDAQLTSLSGLSYTGNAAKAVVVKATEDGFELVAGGGGGTTTNALTINNGGAGAASGATFNGSAAVTISYNTVGAAASSHSHAQADVTGLTTTDSPQFAGINLGHASDTTLTRVSAGVVAIEGSNILTAATGQPLDADLTAIAGLSPSQGDVIYHNGTQWTRLAAGTSGQFLKTLGAGANPTWASAAGNEASCSVPVVSSFSWNNQGVATATDSTGGIILDPGSTSGNVRSLEQNAPATPFDCTIRFANITAASTNNQHGFWLRNSTNSRLIFLGLYNSSATTPARVLVQRWTNNTTFSATVIDVGALGSPCNWLRVNVTSTTITLYASNNGHDWNQLTTETIATFLTATGGGSLDKVGVGALSSGRPIINIQSFSF